MLTLSFVFRIAIFPLQLFYYDTGKKFTKGIQRNNRT